MNFGPEPDPITFVYLLGGMAREDSRPTGMFSSSEMTFENRYSQLTLEQDQEK